MEALITATEANRRFSELLRGVKQGKSFVTTSHGRRVARLCGDDGEEAKQRHSGKRALLKHLQRRRPLKIGAWARDELHERGFSTR